MSNDEVFVYNTTNPVTEEKKPEFFQLVDPAHELLTTKLEDFDFSNPPVNPNEFASKLVDTCKHYKGLGLSANQCGFPYRVFVMGSEDNFIACFNPKVIETEGEHHMPEGCLSFPFLQLNITRPKKIKVEYQDWNGEKHTAVFDGLTARVFLHELDHMEGIVYTIRAKPLALQSGFKKIEKIKRKYFQNVIMKQHLNGNQKTNS